jgi:polysaccharide biosynthesis transport protein
MEEGIVLSRQHLPQRREDSPDPGTVISPTRFGPYKKWHRALRGRYPLVLTLACVCGVAGAYFCSRIQKVQYRSEGLIQIAYELPAVMQKTDQNEPLQMYPEFMQSQVLLAGSREVVSAVLDLPEWKKVAGDTTNIEGFASNLIVDNPSHSQALRIAYQSPSPEIAAAAVRAVVAEYIKRYGNNDAQADAQRLKVLSDRQQAIKSEMQKAIDDMVAQQQPVKPNNIAMVDEVMRDYIRQKSIMERQLIQLQAAKLGPLHPQVIELTEELDLIRAQIAEYTTDFQQMQLGLASIPAGQTSNHAILPAEHKVQLSLEDLNNELEGVNRRVQALQIESSLGSRRFSILSEGGVPTTAYRDRRVLFAGVGGFGGALLPTAFFIVMGLTRGRCRYSDDVHMASTPLLSTLPRLPQDLNDPHLASVAAHRVHNLRVRLQLLNPAQRHQAFMITSSAPGEGKSSLTLALGLSFAGSGSRTLLIDVDMIGRGLSHRTGNFDKPGLLECLASGRLEHTRCLGRNLWLLPAGDDIDFASSTTSPRSLEKLIEQARGEFDHILVDTGPILGSLEAPMVAPAVDDVVLVILRDQQERIIERSMRALQDVGARIAGYVFNRAEASDFGSSFTGSSIRPGTEARNRRRASGEVPTERKAFDPLAISVSCFAPSSTEEAAE